MITHCVFKRFTAPNYKQTALTNQSNAWDALLGEGNLVFRHLLEQKALVYLCYESLGRANE